MHPQAKEKAGRTPLAKIKLMIANGDKTGSSFSGDWNWYRIKVPIADNGQPVVVKIEKTDSRGTDEVVYEETRDPGDTVAERFKGYGESVTFSIYKDGALVRKVTLTPETKPDEPDPDKNPKKPDEGAN